MPRALVIATDFDGTMCSQEYPNIGKPNYRVIKWLRDHQLQGSQLILWTCRTGDELKQAVEWCGLFGIKFDAVNDDVPSVKEWYKNKSVKVCADLYLDDRNLNMESLLCEQ
jgi:hypothetical protein